MQARVVTWNLERKRPHVGLGAVGVEHLFGLDPDVMVLTEARTEFPSRGGHSLWCEPHQGSRFAADERKVLMWSKNPWEDVDHLGIRGLDTSRFVAATTQTAIGRIRVLGICIPWHMAGVTHLIDHEKRKPWELHVDYLTVLGDLLRRVTGPTVIAGDFNQRIPRIKNGNRAAAEALRTTFAAMNIVTEGQIDGTTKPGIDHIALSDHLRARNVWGWRNTINGHRLSDHDGAAADIVIATAPTQR